MELAWQNMVGVTTDGCPSLTEKNVGLLNKIATVLQRLIAPGN